MRNAAALGWGGVVLDETSADPFARRALRVAMGTAFALPHARVGGPRRHDRRDVRRRLDDGGAHAVADDAVDLDDVDPGDRCAIVLGAERSGLSDDVAGACRVRARIPMNPGVDSLNAAAASAIACYRLRRR